MSSPLTYMVLLGITAALVPFPPDGADERKGGPPAKQALRERSSCYPQPRDSRSPDPLFISSEFLLEPWMLRAALDRGGGMTQIMTCPFGRPWFAVRGARGHGRLEKRLRLDHH